MLNHIESIKFMAVMLTNTYTIGAAAKQTRLFK